MGILLYIVIILPLYAIWLGFVLTKLWAWFAVPAFGAPPLSIAAAVGISLIVGLVARQHPANETEGKTMAEILTHGTVIAAMKPAIALFFGWIAAQWM